MALGSKASKEARQKRREAERQAKMQALTATEREVQAAMATLTPTEHDRRVLKAEAYVLALRLSGLPPTPENVDFANFNLVRIAEGKEPIERREPRVPREMVRGIRQRRNED